MFSIFKNCHDRGFMLTVIILEAINRPLILMYLSSIVFYRLADAQDEIVKLRARSGLIDTYERQVRNLKDELSFASTKKSYLDG